MTIRDASRQFERIISRWAGQTLREELIWVPTDLMELSGGWQYQTMIEGHTVVLSYLGTYGITIDGAYRFSDYMVGLTQVSLLCHLAKCIDSTFAPDRYREEPTEVHSMLEFLISTFSKEVL